MILDIVGVITTSKLGILKTFQGGLFQPPPSCQIGLIMSSRVIVEVFFLEGVPYDDFRWWTFVNQNLLFYFFQIILKIIISITKVIVAMIRPTALIIRAKRNNVDFIFC